MARFAESGVPDNITFKTKAEPRLEMLLAAKERGRHPTRKQVVEREPVEVRKLVEELPGDAWNHIFPGLPLPLPPCSL